MSEHRHHSAAEVQARLDHPVIDADGHWQEYLPAVLPALERIGGPAAADGFARASRQIAKSLEMSVAERRHRRIAQQAFWGMPTANTRDRATAMMPALLYERLDELGLDFAILYPTQGLSPILINDTEVRRATCRAFNTYCAELFAPFADRMTPAAIIPMHDPDEAVAELTHAHELGLKVILLASLIRRPVPAVAEGAVSGVRAPNGIWQDVLGIDSDHDYDPVWAACAELGLSPTFHMGTRGSGLRNSPTNFVFNHIGHFAQANEAVCKALFLGGVTRRFPTVRFGFLEGGVGWAANLLADLVGHWEKRCRAGLEATNPANLDRALLNELADRYADRDTAAAIRRGDGLYVAEASDAIGGIADLDDYSACGIEDVDDIRRLFVESFSFGCEADDPTNAWAFNRAALPFHSPLRATFGSDIGHFDVPDMAGVLPEAYELVEDGLVDADDFRDFTFANAVRFFAGPNPRFFEGTAVADAAAGVLAAEPALATRR
jgi:predicted TIM-barrel fold metal-dependent hydrolase